MVIQGSSPRSLFSVAFDEALEGRYFQGQQFSDIIFCGFR